MKQKVSELMDGELPAEHLDLTLTHLKDNVEALEAWDTYQVIGDALRGDLLSGSRVSQRVTHALASEPTVLAPRRAAPALSRFGVRVGLAVAAAVVTLSMVTFVLRQQSVERGAPETPVASIDAYVRAHHLLIPGAGFQGPEDSGFRVSGYAPASTTQDPGK